MKSIIKQTKLIDVRECVENHFKSEQIKVGKHIFCRKKKKKTIKRANQSVALIQLIREMNENYLYLHHANWFVNCSQIICK